MATSGSTNYTETRDTIIEDAFAVIGYVHDDMENQDNDYARRVLNRLAKSWQKHGLHLWSKTEGVLFLDQYTDQHQLTGTSSGAKFANADDVVITTLSADEALGQTILSVTDSTGMAASDVVGVVDDAGAVHWSTIVTVDSSTQITINDATTVASASGNNVYTFTTYVAVPRRILNARLVESGIKLESSTATISEIPMTQMSHEEYFELNTKTSNGVPTYYYYNRQRDQGNLHVWPRSSTSYRLNVTYERFLEDFDAENDNPDFPIEWVKALILNLAVDLAPAYGRAVKVREDGTDIKAATELNECLGWDRENDSVQFVPDRRT